MGQIFGKLSSASSSTAESRGTGQQPNPPTVSPANNRQRQLAPPATAEDILNLVDLIFDHPYPVIEAASAETVIRIVRAIELRLERERQNGYDDILFRLVAAALLQQAVSHSHTEAMFHLGELLVHGATGIERNVVKGAQLWRRAADLGEVNAMYQLGVLLKNGAIGVERNATEAAQLWQRAAHLGQVKAMYEWGVLLKNGATGVEPNATEARRLLRRAANHDEVKAMYELGVLLKNGATGVEPNATEARRLLLQAAALGKANAMYELGVLMKNGATGVEPNVTEAEKLWRRAADLGEANAMYELGVLLERGATGVEQNVNEAASFFRRAAELTEAVESSTGKVERFFLGTLWQKAASCGDSVAMFKYGLLLLEGSARVERNVAEAAEMLRRAADLGEVNAMYQLGVVLERGATGVEPNLTAASQLWQQAADLGEVNAMYRLGLLLLEGAEGVECNATKAAELLRRAADLGEVRATYRLGLLLLDGMGEIEPNIARGQGLLRQAAHRGEVGAMLRLGLLLLEGGNGVEQNAKEAETLLRDAADREDVNAMFRLGCLLQEGAQGITRNPEEAALFYARAVEHGDARAMVNLGLLLHEGGSGVEKAVRNARFDLPLSGNDTKRGETATRRTSSALTAYGISRICAVHGIAWNVSEALAALRGAIERGNGQAVIMLAYMVSRGKCSDSDFAEAMLSFEASWYEWPDPDSVCITDVIGAAKALLSMEIGNSRNPDLARRLLEKLLSYEPTYGPALHELAVLYEHGDEGVPRDEEKAKFYFEACLYSDIYSLRSIEGAIVGAGQSYHAAVERILNVGTSKPKTCLLVTLGGGGRGKTATVNSLRRMPFVIEHEQTQMAAFNKCVVDPGGERRDEEEIEEISFQDNSLRVNTGRLRNISDISLTAEGIASHSAQFEAGTLEKDSQRRCIAHNDVIEQIRRSILHDSFPPMEFEGSFVQIWDMAGQFEYEMAHSMVIGQASILVFVTDLERVENELTRVNEVRELCYWMQLAFLLVHSEKLTRALIVATKKGKCNSVQKALTTLQLDLAKDLDTKLYDTWVKGSRIIAIENSESLNSAKASGREEVERTIQAAAKEVLELRESVPLRWLALVEELERKYGDGKRVYVTREHVLGLVKDFPGYVDDDEERGKDVLVGLKCLASMGRLVLLEIGSEEWYVFLDVEKIVRLLGRTTEPSTMLNVELKASDLRSLDEGRISQSGLFRLWEGYNEDEKEVLLKLLCRFDLLMLLEGDEECIANGNATIGIPARMPYGCEGMEWGRLKGERDVEVETRFEIALPHGLIGGLMAWMHRKRAEQTKSEVRDFPISYAKTRANAILLKENGGIRVLICFEATKRKLRMIFRGQTSMTALVRMYLQLLKEYLRSRVQGTEVKFEHFALVECKSDHCQNKKDCEEVQRRTIEVPLGENWVSGEEEERMRNEPPCCQDCFAPCSDFNNLGISHLPRSKYDVFISHAGPDKRTVAIPLRTTLQHHGVHAFVDVEDLKLSTGTAPQEMLRAMGEAIVGVFILSPEFAARKWPMIELRHFLERKGKRTDGPALLPIFLRLGVLECRLAREKVYHEESTYYDLLEKERFFEPDRLKECNVETASSALSKLSGYTGVVTIDPGRNVKKSSSEMVLEAADQILWFLKKSPPHRVI